MACCTGQTKCNDTVTIGYLKDLVNGIVSVTTSKSDSYCPTYAELTGGTLVPNFVDGGTNKWASNVDGISVNGTYENTQVVKVENLRVIYTRFKSITASASPTSLSECGGSTTLGYEFKLTKNTKGISDCSTGGTDTATEEGSDTASTVTYSSTQSWLAINGSTATAPKNGTVSAATRSTNVTASVTYRGSVHTSNTITISQAALTGAYETTGTSTATGIDVTYTPTTRTFGCEGGTYTVEAVGKYYTRYKWKDSCGTVYNEVYNDVQGSSNLQTKTGTFAEVLCPTTSSTSSSTASYSWSGITTSVTFTQNCSQSCGECEDYIVWGSGNGTATAPCEGGNVQVSANVSGVKHTKDYVGGVCQETGTATTSQTQSVTVVIPKNDTDSGKTYNGSETTSQGGTINYTITQPGGCSECTGATTTTEWSGQTVSAAACDTSKNLTLSGTSTTTYDNCSPKIESVTSAVTVNFNENNTSNPTSYTFAFSNATVTVNQAAGPCECLNPTYAYKFDDITVSCDSATSVTQNAKYTKYTNYSNCSTVSETGRTNVTIPAVSCNSGSSRVIQAGASASTLASASPKITQDGGCTCTSCTCNDLNVEQVASLPSSSGNNVTIAKYSADCLTNLAVTESANWITNATLVNGEVKASISANTGNTSRSTTITISGKTDGQNCSSSVTVSQDGVACTCDSLSAFSVSAISAASGTGIVVATYTAANCITNISATTNETWLVITGVTNGNVYANVSANTSTTQDRTANITVSGTAISTDCTKTATLTQSKRAAITCDCDNLVITSGGTPVSTLNLEFNASGTYIGSTIRFESDGNCDGGFNYTDFSIVGNGITGSVNSSGNLSITTSGNTTYDTPSHLNGEILYDGVTCTTFSCVVDPIECDCDIFDYDFISDFTARTFSGVEDLQVATCVINPLLPGAYDGCIDTDATNGLVIEGTSNLSGVVLREDGINYSVEASVTPNYGYDDKEAYIDLQIYYNGEPCLNSPYRVSITVPPPNRDPNVRPSMWSGMCNSPIKFYMGTLLPCGGGKIPQ